MLLERRAGPAGVVLTSLGDPLILAANLDAARSLCTRTIKSSFTAGPEWFDSDGSSGVGGLGAGRPELTAISRSFVFARGQHM
jgi:hypothetical protein